ncbi:threonine aspartase 1 [Nannizzia gypsea CBS 118893]|uniref:Threonine aspartase 1 n=1 Tax=Arthroderma gypseum (strain ATCC MYA-4604 / CBS 118893) TaxID=535722 RepID=E4UMS7_ARTGP|nr:threonine aspartase 1 [Nannizzia gypsea CBS 118893]EFR00281.1 threonine aspartase 1 [Nannizzia gypsea CBS 118893]
MSIQSQDSQGSLGVSAIFVHAGAGFHSRQSEELHLWVCSKASSLGMAILKTGGSAVDAVEVAIKFFEDHEVTNAGYGSNLTITGAVECDATIVDHLGRSGAVGAVQNIKNPISLARVVLDASTKPLSLNRVPPNFLVCGGATDFAYEHGIPVLPSDILVAPAARDRWLRWKRDLEQVSQRLQKREKYVELDNFVPQHPSQRVSQASTAVASIGSPHHNTCYGAHSLFHVPRSPVHVTNICPSRDAVNMIGSNRCGSPLLCVSRSDISMEGDGEADAEFVDDTFHQDPLVADTSSWRDSTDSQKDKHVHYAEDAEGETDSATRDAHDLAVTRDEDEITDTVGAIAIDCYGNIAAGSSSGGIGMKHNGRTGPAALVGIGTAVIPVDPEDEMYTSTAAVASGTGEHMTTTMAAQTCAERIYASTKKVPGKPGVYEPTTEDEVIKSMIQTDFMGHPAVKSSHCHAAIGVMTVKKTHDGIIFVFGHNTDSFAVASMSSDDVAACCTMSRSPGDRKVAQGGRFIRSRRLDLGTIHPFLDIRMLNKNVLDLNLAQLLHNKPNACEVHCDIIAVLVRP